MNEKFGAALALVHPILQGAQPPAPLAIIDGYRRLKAKGKLAHLDVTPLLGSAATKGLEEFWQKAFNWAIGKSTTTLMSRYYHSLRLAKPREAIDVRKGIRPEPRELSNLDDAFTNTNVQCPREPVSFLRAVEASAQLPSLLW